MISQKVLHALNDQLNFEFHSAFHYLAMESYFHFLNLHGFANFMREQYREERSHALKIVDHINGRGCRPKLSQIAEPPAQWGSALESFEDAYQQEQKSSGIINDLVDLAIAEKDHPTDIFLKWFITNQVEEEATISSIVQKLRLVGDDKYGLFLLDRDMARM
ncbi:MAG: ferritin [bacterium]|jgi:ferritin|nr:ferritin [bacterium]